jgi:ferrous iron transport protein B
MDTQTQCTYRRIALVGNPNTGKTTLFNALTGLNHKVSNYPGVTVERKIGHFQLHDQPFEIVDLPGTYSLSAYSPDELVVTDILLNQQAGEEPIDLVIAIVDASNLNRHFYLLSQLFELGLPIIVALNMIDIAEARNLRIDVQGLSHDLGIPIVPMCANSGRGIEELKKCIEQITAGHGAIPRIRPHLPDSIQSAFHTLREWIRSHEMIAGRSIPDAEIYRAFMDKEGVFEQRLARILGPSFIEELQNCRNAVHNTHSLTAIEAKSRYDWIATVLYGHITHPEQPVRILSDKLDRILMHKIYGMVIFFVVMALMFQSIFTWAAPIMDLIDAFFAAAGQFVLTFMPEGTLRSLLVDGIVAGVGGVLIFLPQIAILFFFIAILEDCGYLPRAASLMDRFLSRFGLSGQSFIPMLSSFACAVPGVMATRTIADRQSRLLTILVAPLMSCSARLPVYLIFIAAFVPDRSVLGSWINLQGFTLLAMYLIGIVTALAVSLMFRRTLMKKTPSHFILEMPTYKMPLPRTVLFYVYERSKDFVVRAGTIILCVSVLVWALAYFPHPASITQEFDRQREEAEFRFRGDALSILRTINLAIGDASLSTQELIDRTETDPALQNPVSNTPAARYHERIIEYENRLAGIDAEAAGEFIRRSYLGRMGKLIEPIVTPLGWDWRIGMATLASFPARELIVAALSTILNTGADVDDSSVSLRAAIAGATREDGSPLFTLAVALSVMVFFALCCQCAATLAIIKRETNSWFWPVFTFTYMTVLAYSGAFLTYRIGLWLGLT